MFSMFSLQFPPRKNYEPVVVGSVVVSVVVISVVVVLGSVVVSDEFRY